MSTAQVDSDEPTSDVDYEPSESDSTSTTGSTDTESILDLPSDDFSHISPTEYSDDSRPFSPPQIWDDNMEYAAGPSDGPRPTSSGESNVMSQETARDDVANPPTPPPPAAAARSQSRRRHDSGIGASDDNSPSKPSDAEGPSTSKAVQKRKRNTVYCFFCEEPVLQFARHLARQHDSELEVQRLKALRKNSVERKRLLGIIRNKGNYLQSKVINFVRPVRKPALKGESSLPLPCTHCYGFFAKKQLWRHVRRCPANKNKNAAVPPFSHNMAHNMMLSQVEGNDFLKNNVFPHMRVDSVTEAVKTDPLICAYGARFAKTHEQKHQVNFISRKMRELAKLVIALKKADPQIKSLVDALHPSRYQLLVQCTKEVARFDHVNRRYLSPTYAMNIQTSLKDCCRLACNFLYQHAQYPDKKTYEEAEFPFLRLIGTITSEWRFDVSHQAANDLQTSSMNKITMVPLATDLYRFKQFLLDLGNESLAALQYDERNVRAYKNLLETAYCRVMLLCRKRCGELSRLTVEVYKTAGERHSYEEFADTIRPSEMLLVRKFKRVVIQGKRQCTPVIFSDDVQRHIDVLLQVRDNFVPATNPYLFGNVNTDNPISGYKVIQRHASNANLVHPEAMTTRCLRKHLATVCQVLSMSDEDIEQLATFMGHTGGVHRREYRLPDALFQTAKVSKLLLMMEAGQAGQFKGKTLDEIQVDLDTDLLREIELEGGDEDDDEELAKDHSTTRELNLECVRPEKPQCASSNIPTASTSQSQRAKTRKFQRDPWSEEEKRIVLEFFSEHLSLKKPPKKEECELLISQHPDVFKNRPWQKIKVFIHNAYSKRS